MDAIQVTKLACSSETAAFSLEKVLIAALRAKGVFLANQTDGGEGSAGWKAPSSYKQAKSIANKGDKNPFFGKKHSPKVVAFLSEKAKAQFSSQESRKENSARGKKLVGGKNPFFGKKHSADTRLAISQKKKGSSPPNHSEAARRKMSEANLGERHWNYGKKTPEHVKLAIASAMKCKIGYKWMQNGVLAKQVRPEDAEDFLLRGWAFGKKIVTFEGSNRATVKES